MSDSQTSVALHGRQEQVGVKSSAARPRAVRLAGLGLGAAALLILLSGCSVDGVGKAFGNFGWPSKGVSLQAHKMYDLWIASVIAALIVGIFVWGLIFWCVIRYRKRGDQLPVQTRFNMPMETLYTVTPILIVAVLFYYTAIVQTRVNRETQNPDVTIGVVGFKWNWQFRYPDELDKDGKAIETTGTSEEVPILVLPTTKRIRFEETSNDVIHSFWVPDMLFKRDVIPGKVNQFEISKIDRTGTFIGRCAEFCGTDHPRMNFTVQVVEPAQFDQMMQGFRSAATQASAPAPATAGTGQ